jgi:hypothetical protein
MKRKLLCFKIDPKLIHPRGVSKMLFFLLKRRATRMTGELIKSYFSKVLLTGNTVKNFLGRSFSAKHSGYCEGGSLLSFK